MDYLEALERTPVDGKGVAPGTAHGGRGVGDEAGDEVLIDPAGLSILQRHSDDLVPGPAGAVPRAVLRDKDLVSVRLRKSIPRVKGHSEGGCPRNLHFDVRIPREFGMTGRLTVGVCTGLRSI